MDGDCKNTIAKLLVVFIRFQFSAHGGQLYKRISLESSLNSLFDLHLPLCYILVGLSETQE